MDHKLAVAFVLLFGATLAGASNLGRNHTFGVLSRPTSLPLRRCDRAAETDGSLPVTNRYLQKIFHHMVRANASTFVGDLDPSLFCVGALLDSNPRAMTDATRRTLIFWSALIELAQHDAHIASVMGHELAHSTMRHNYLDATLVPRDRFAMQERMREIYQIESQLAPLREELKRGNPSAELKATYDRGIVRLDALRAQTQALTLAELGAEAAANWEETEADQVGLEFYLRSGFPAYESTWRYEELLTGSPSPAEATRESAHRRRLAAYRACGAQSAFTLREPVRGVERYAGLCWLMWSLTIDEWREHGAAYRALQSATTLTQLPGEPTLAQAQEEIRRVTAARPRVTK